MLNALTTRRIENALSEHGWTVPGSHVPSRVPDPDGDLHDGWSRRTYRRGTEADRVHYTNEYEGWSGWREVFDSSSAEPVPLDIDGTAVTVKRVGDTHTGGEGGGEDIEMIFEITDGQTTRYFRKTGYYYSYDGSNWDGSFDEVQPVQKYVTVYEAL